MTAGEKKCTWVPAWDGTIDDKPAPADVYVWRLMVHCNGEQTPLAMEVTLLR